MITDIYTPIDESCAKSLKIIQTLIDSDSFLAGLGKHNLEHPVPSGFNIVLEFDRCWYLLTSQDMWGDLDNPDGDQNFVEVIGGAVSFLGTDLYDEEEAKKRERECFSEANIKKLNELVIEKVKTSYARNEIPYFLSNQFKKADPELLSVFLNEQLQQFTVSIFNDFIRGAYFGGLQRWPVSEYLLQTYLIGGFPTGWVGPKPIDGGASQNCMHVLHFGPESKVT